MKLHHLILKLAFKAFSAREGPRIPLDRSRVGSILVMTTTAIGDTVMSTPAIRAVRRNFPKARVTALVSVAAREVLSGNACVDAFIKYPGRINLGYLLKLPGFLKELRAGSFDLVIALHSNDPDAGPIAYMTKAPWRIGPAESGFAFLFTNPVRMKAPGTHFVDARLKNLSALGIAPHGRHMDFFLDEEDLLEARAFLSDNGVKGERLITLHPFGSKRNKWWPLEHTGTFSALAKVAGFTTVVLGGPREAKAAEASALPAGAVSAAGRLSLRGSAALISLSDAVVTTDSGLMHLAQALRTPTIALFGPDDPEVSGPVNNESVVMTAALPCAPCRSKACALPQNDCMRGILPEEVLQRVLDSIRTGRQKTAKVIHFRNPKKAQR